MTDTDKTRQPIIYAWGDFGPDSVTGRWGANTYPNEAVAYVPQDLSDARVAAAVKAEREACAEIVEHNSEFVRSTDNSRHLQPRSEGDRMALGYADAIRARGEGRDDDN